MTMMSRKDFTDIALMLIAVWIFFPTVSIALSIWTFTLDSSSTDSAFAQAGLVNLIALLLLLALVLLWILRRLVKLEKLDEPNADNSHRHEPVDLGYWIRFAAMIFAVIYSIQFLSNIPGFILKPDDPYLEVAPNFFRDWLVTYGVSAAIAAFVAWNAYRIARLLPDFGTPDENLTAIGNGNR